MEEITDSELEALENLREPESPGKDSKKPICEHKEHTLMLFDYEIYEHYEHFMNSCYYCYNCKKVIQTYTYEDSCTDGEIVEIYDSMYDYITKVHYNIGIYIRSNSETEKSKEIIEEVEKIVIDEMSIPPLKVLSARILMSNADENIFQKDVSRDNFDVMYVFGSLYSTETVFSKIIKHAIKMKWVNC